MYKSDLRRSSINKDFFFTRPCGDYEQFCSVPHINLIYTLRRFVIQDMSVHMTHVSISNLLTAKSSSYFDNFYGDVSLGD